jgi:RHS repeat-associated protein
MSLFSRGPGDRPPGPSTQSPPQNRFQYRRHRIAVSILLTILLLTEVFNGWSVASASSQSTGITKPVPATMTLKQFLKQGHADRLSHGTPKITPNTKKLTPPDLTTSTGKRLPSAEPPKMQALSTTLTASTTQTTTSTATPTTTTSSAPVDLKGSDGRFELLLPAGDLDASQTTLDGKPLPVGPLTVKITQLHGHLVGPSVELGAYQFQILDSKGNIISGVHLKQPATILYHYQTGELENFGLDPGEIHLSWTTLLAQANAANKPTAGLEVPMTNNTKTQTLSAQVTILATSAATPSGDPTVQPPPTPHLASVSGNSGQLSYSYPLPIPAGPGGFAPQLQLTYSSESTNERYSARSPAGPLGDGWSLGLGSISSEKYTDDSAGGKKTWYSLSSVGGVSDRLIPGSDDNTYETQHLSHMKIKYSDSCFHIWDRSGNYYELGCTDDSREYTTNSNGDKTNYQWNLNRMVAPFESTKQVKTILISYLQDKHDKDGHTTIRDSGIKQIKYGVASSLSASSLDVLTAGTLDFHYLAPSSNGKWADSYGKNHNCASSPPDDTTMRCDDPISRDSNDPPDVMSTLTLDKITSYIGDDSNDGKNSFLAYSYAFTYHDDPFRRYTDPITDDDENAAGDHLLRTVTPTIYQSGKAIQRLPLNVQYSGTLENTYYDGDNDFSAKTKWRYLTSYLDEQTGIGGTVNYQTAYGNTHGTPNASDGDTRYDPLYCSNHSGDCSGDYNHPDEYAWSTQVVTSLISIGKDSSASGLSNATSYYGYSLAVTGNDCPKAGSNKDCVGYTWAPVDDGSKDKDWKDYYHSEFRGFAAVYITSPAGDLTADHYYSTAGRFTDATKATNYNSGQLYEEDVYEGNQESDSALLKQTVNTYAGEGPHNACRSDLNQIYGACEIVNVSTKTTFYEGTGTSNTNAPWTETDNTYDDYDPNNGLNKSSSVYHNLTQTVTTSSNAPAVTKKFQYAVTNETDNNVTYYHVDLQSRSEIDDSSGHVWQCDKTYYDEGRPSGVPAPAAGWMTSKFTYSNCANQSQSVLTSYIGYDVYGNAVATVDAFGTANSSIYAGGKGCTLSTAPAYMAGGWTAGHYTTCTVYDKDAARATSAQNVLAQSTSTSYDYAQGGLQTSAVDINGQTTSTSYSYDSNGDRTISLTQPGETASYTRRSSELTHCTASSTLPCYEIDSVSSLYPNAVKRTFYDAQGRAIETRTPGPDAGHDTITFTVNNDATNASFVSVAFRVASSAANGGWIDPNGATDETGAAPGGTTTYKDALGRVIGTQDPLLGSTSEPGISCPGLSGVWTTCTTYGIGTPKNDTASYDYTVQYDANNHVAVTFTDALNRTRFEQWYSGNFSSISQNITKEQETQYNVLDKPTAVIVTDLVPQSGQTITSSTTTATYDDMGRITALNDPDRGPHTYTYDADGHQITDVSGSRTIGTSYDLLGRAICIQDAAPTTDGSGNCSSGSHPLVQNTYETSKLSVAGTTDYPLGRLTQSIGTTYYPDGTSVSVTEQFQHDTRDRITATTLQVSLPSGWNVTNALPTYQQTLAYDDANNVTVTHTTGGGQQGYTFTQSYDSTTGQINGLSNNNVASPSLATLGYDLHGLVSDINFMSASGTALANNHYTYDGNLRPVSASATWQSGSGSSGTIFSVARNYDAAGNVTSENTTYAPVSGQNNSGGGETQNFCYDEQNRLVWAGNTGTQPAADSGTCGTATLSNTLGGNSYNSNYAYTNLGQLWQGPLNGSGNSLQYLYCDSNHPHQLTGLYPVGTSCSNLSSTNYHATYDAWGNMATRTYNAITSNLSFDALDHFVQWNAGSKSQDTYAYDATGTRILRRSNDGTGVKMTVYAFGLEEHVYDGTGTNLSNTYYYTLHDRLIGKFDGTNSQFYLTNELGSVLTTFSDTSGSAVVLGNQTYGPFGNQRYSSGSMGTDKGFTGQYHDPVTGLDYYVARYYDPVVGYFLTPDTVQANLQGMDPYTYVGDNPETHNDATGHCWPVCTVIAGAVIGGLISGGTSLISQAMSGHGVNWSEVGKEAAVGAVSGAVSGLAGPEAGLAVHSIVGAAAGAAGKMVENAFDHKPITDGVVEAAVSNGVMAGVGEAAGPLLKQAAGSLKEAAGGLINKVTSSVGEDATSAVASACGLSFASNTPVATPTGEKPIADIQVGDQVQAYDVATQKETTQTVQQIFINHDNDLIDVTIRVDTTAKPTTKADANTKQQDAEVNSHGSHAPPAETIHTTEKHPWLTTKGWITAGELSIGDHVLRLDGSTGTVVSLRVIPGEQDMYDLTVSNAHTFAAGMQQFIVHNIQGCGSNGTAAAFAKAKELWQKTAQAGGNMLAATVGVGFREDGTMLVSLNQRSLGGKLAQAGHTTLDEPAANLLKGVVEKEGELAQYVGPDKLVQNYSSDLPHAEDFIRPHVGPGELTGIGSYPPEICERCYSNIYAEQPDVIDNFRWNKE